MTAHSLKAEMFRLIKNPLSLPMISWAGLTLALLGGLWAYLQHDRAAHIEAGYRDSNAAARAGEQAILRAFEVVSSVHDLLQIKYNLAEWNASPAGMAIDGYIRRLADSGRFGLVQVAITNMDGTIVWGSVPGSANTQVADREHIRVHLDNQHQGTFISAPVIGRTSGRWSIQVTQLLRNEAGEPVGVSAVSLNPLALSAVLPRDPGSTRRTAVYRLLDGVTIARSDDVPAYREQLPDPDHPVVVAARGAAQGRVQFRSRFFEQPSIASFRVLAGLPLVLASVHDLEDELQSFRQTAFVLGIVTLLLIAAAFRAALAWGRSRESAAQFLDDAQTDPLTGLLNRRAMGRYANKLLPEAQESGETIAVLILDLDHFKSINDTYGHDAGDTVLRDVGVLLRRSLRRGDVVCRWGGEEMVALLRQCGQADAQHRAEEIRELVSQMYQGNKGPVPQVTASIGVAVYPSHGNTLKDLVHQADTALYRAKQGGRDRVYLAQAA